MQNLLERRRLAAEAAAEAVSVPETAAEVEAVPAVGLVCGPVKHYSAPASPMVVGPVAHYKPTVSCLSAWSLGGCLSTLLSLQRGPQASVDASVHC